MTLATHTLFGGQLPGGNVMLSCIVFCCDGVSGELYVVMSASGELYVVMSANGELYVVL